jgi:hypothetical protein
VFRSKIESAYWPAVSSWRQAARLYSLISPFRMDFRGAAGQGNRVDGQLPPRRPWPRVLLSVARASLRGPLGARTHDGRRRPRIPPRGVYVLVSGVWLGWEESGL